MKYTNRTKRAKYCIKKLDYLTTNKIYMINATYIIIVQNTQTVDNAQNTA